MTDRMRQIRKALTAVAAGIAIAITATVDGTVTTSEWLTILLAVLGALGVYAIPNQDTPPPPDPPAPYTRFIDGADA